MRKNGFTLIELLAVIVILAIIALIATPIILGIINDAREESQERSIELYASAVRNGIAAYQLREMKEVAAGTYKSSDLTFVEYDGDVECDTIDIYEDGGVYVADCTVNGIDVEYTYGTKQVAKGTIGICNPLNVQTAGTYTAGDKYECDVDPNKEGYDQIFYVLTNATSGSVNLIMDSNITRTGDAIKDANPTDKGLVPWINQGDYITSGGEDMSNDEGECQYSGFCALNTLGPITAMNYLQDATKDWTNVNPQTISTFTDNAGETHEMAKIFNVNARLPYHSEISNVNNTTLYLNDYLDGTGDAEFEIVGKNGVSGVDGYWTLSSDASYSNIACYVNCYSFADCMSGFVHGDVYGGVRPVINLSI